MPRRLTSSPVVSLPRTGASAASKPAAQQAPIAAGWKAKSATRTDQRRMLDRTLNDAITMPAGATFNTRVGHVRAAAATVGSDGTRVISEQLAAKLPARSAEERARILALATALGAKTPMLTQQLLKDAISAGDASLALELVYDGAKLSKSDRTALAPHLRGDEVLLNPDATKNLARAAVSVLADQPAELQRFAKSLSTPALLFTEVMANKDKAGESALKPLVGLLSPREADGLARSHPRSELSAELRARASQR